MKRRKSYAEYLKSKHWRTKRQEALDYYGSVCTCGSTSNLQVHHRTYENLGNESMGDLSVLCKTCHEEHHKIESVKRIVRVKRSKAKPGTRAVLGGEKQALAAMKERMDAKPMPDADEMIDRMIRQAKRKKARRTRKY